MKLFKASVTKLISVLLSATVIVTSLSLCSFSAIAETLEIPPNAKYYNGHYYYVYNDGASSWEEAKDRCNSRGGYLATITSGEENKVIYEYIKSKGYTNAFFGLYSTGSAEQRQWQWVTGENFEYSNWGETQPDDYHGRRENYGMYWNGLDEGFWNDGAWGDDTKAYICEWTSYYVKVSESKVTLATGESEIVDYTVKGDISSLENKTASWKSSNKNIAKVSSQGKIVAVKPGVCTITCKVGLAKKEIKVIVKPKKVTGFKKTSSSKNQITLSWKKQDGVTGYKIYMYDKDLGEYTYLKTVDGDFRRTTIKNLKKGKTYKFIIRAYVKTNPKKYYGEFSKVLVVKK